MFPTSAALPSSPYWVAAPFSQQAWGVWLGKVSPGWRVASEDSFVLELPIERSFEDAL